MKKKILDTIRDLVSDFVYYDRRGDDELSIKQLNNAVYSGQITIDEMVEEFKKQLGEVYPNCVEK
jgi:hypothetical protein